MSKTVIETIKNIENIPLNNLLVYGSKLEVYIADVGKAVQRLAELKAFKKSQKSDYDKKNIKSDFLIEKAENATSLYNLIQLEIEKRVSADLDFDLEISKIFRVETEINRDLRSAQILMQKKN